MIVVPLAIPLILGAAIDLPLLPLLLGALAALVPGGIFAALRYRRDDDSAVVTQAAQVSDAAVDVITALRSELEHTREDLAEERAARRELAGELRELRTEMTETRGELASTTEEVVRLRRILAARGIGDK